jgi:hypothetical protein
MPEAKRVDAMSVIGGVRVWLHDIDGRCQTWRIPDEIAHRLGELLILTAKGPPPVCRKTATSGGDGSPPAASREGEYDDSRDFFLGGA